MRRLCGPRRLGVNEGERECEYSHGGETGILQALVSRGDQDGSLLTATSFVPKNDHRIGLRGANRRDQAGDAGGGKEQGRVAGKDEEIVRGDAE